jgi:RluA family pseudouridine synthase
VAKLPYIELSNGLKIPILHEDRNVIAIDKPQGWMLAPVSWQNTSRNLFAALTSSVSAGDFWARSRNLKFIRFVHRLDAETSGVLLLVKAPGAVPAYTELFEDRKVQKVYLAVVKGVPEIIEWKCRLRIAPMAERAGLMEINNALGKDSETLFRVIDKQADRALVMCWPLTGRTHQIRLHLAAVGHPVWGDELYGKVPTTEAEKTDLKLGLRSIRLCYKDPFLAEPVTIGADPAAFVKLHGFDASNKSLAEMSPPEKALEHPKARLEETRLAEKTARKEQRDAQRATRPAREYSDERPRTDWQQEEDSGGFAAEVPREQGERPFRPRAPREFDRGPRRAPSDAPYRPRSQDAGAPPRRRYEDQAGRGPQRESRYGDRPQRPAGPGRSFGGPRQFEGREGGYNRKPAGGGYPERREREGGFGRKPFGGGGGYPERRESAGGYGRKPSGGGYPDRREREGGFGNRPPARPGYGRKPYGAQGDSAGGSSYGGPRPGGFRGRPAGKPGYGRPQDDRGERRPYGPRRDFDRGGRGDDARGGQPQSRPGVFPSSAKTGLKAGFQSGGFGPRADRRPFRSATGDRRPPSKFAGPRGGAGKFGGNKFAGGKPGSGGGPRPSRGFGRGPR